MISSSKSIFFSILHLDTILVFSISVLILWWYMDCSNCLRWSSCCMLCTEDILCRSHILQFCFSYPALYIYNESHHTCMVGISQSKQYNRSRDTIPDLAELSDIGFFISHLIQEVLSKRSMNMCDTCMCNKVNYVI